VGIFYSIEPVEANMLIAGLDLAAEPKGTALALIEWSPGRAELVSLDLGIDDDSIIRAVADCPKFGIDCALGWPIAFVEFLNQHSHIDGPHQDFDGGIESRRKLAYRETDRHVREVTGRWPLSVSTDRLGMTAMRCAGLLSKLTAAVASGASESTAASGASGEAQSNSNSIDRSGSGRVVEIYPGASLRLWGFDTAGYRNSPEIRARLLSDIQAAAPWLALEKFTELMVSSCDAFDAVIASLAARSAFLGHYEGPKANQKRNAQIEGWVALPNTALATLVEPPTS
jgi:predicted nuclease with RNAse H fold